MVLKILDVGKPLGILQAIKNPLTYVASGFPVSVRMLSNSKLVELGGFIILLGILVFTNQLAYIANFPLLNDLVLLG